MTAFSYPEVGATRGPDLPSGYRWTSRRRRLGSGRPCFAAASELLLSWEMHRRAGLQVDSGALVRVEPGAAAVLRIGWRGLAVPAPVRVVYVIDEPDRRGFAYGTLAGHPETGEEQFVVGIDDLGTVHGCIRAFSRPSSILARLGGPVTRLVQDQMTKRYLDALAG